MWVSVITTLIPYIYASPRPLRRTNLQMDDSSTVTIDDEETELTLEGMCYVKV